MISVAKEDGDFIRIYDENGNYKSTISACDGLVGFTATTVSVRDGIFIRIYDENGNYKNTIS